MPSAKPERSGKRTKTTGNRAFARNTTKLLRRVCATNGSLGRSAGLRVGAEHLMHVFDGHASSAYRSTASLHRTGPHIAGCKDPWAARLKRIGRTIRAFPRRGVCDRRTGFNKFPIVQEYFSRKPLCAWLRANHRKNGDGFHYSALACLGVCDFYLFEPNLPHHFPNL